MTDLQAWVRHHDEEALRRLVERHAGMVHATCRRQLSNPAAIDEAAQAAFIVLARRAHRVADEAGLGPWLHAVALRTSRTVARGERRRRHHEQEATMRATPPSVGDAWEDARPHLDAALASLPATTRAAVIGFYLQGKAHAEVAAGLGISEAAVRQRVHWALERLRELLAGKGVAVSAVALSAGLASEAAAAQPAVVAACAGAAIQPATAAGAATVASSVIAAGTAKIVLLAAGLAAMLLAGAFWARGAFDHRPAPPAVTAAAEPPPPPAPAPAPPPAPVPLPELGRVADDDATPVGEWTVLSKIRFFGNQAFTTRQLHNGISRNFPVLSAGHARAPRGAYLRMLQSQIEAGYRAAGHLRVQVRVGTIDGRIGVCLEEGPRFIAGPVEITGMNRAPAQQLAAALTDPSANLNPLVGQFSAAAWQFSPKNMTSKRAKDQNPNQASWSPGGVPANDQAALQRIEADVTGWYEHKGWMGARCAATVEMRGSTAVLRLAMLDEGRPAQVARIDWRGVVRSSIPALEEALGLKVGVPGDTFSASRIQLWLAHSGRFRTQRVQVTEEAEGYVITITVDESTIVPPFPEPLGEVGDAVLRCQQWLSDHLSTGDDALVARLTFSQGTLDLAQSPSGMALSYTLTAGGSGVLWSDGDSIRVLDPGLGKGFVTSGFSRLQPQVMFSTESKRGEGGLDKNVSNFSFRVAHTTGHAQGQFLNLDFRSQPMLSTMLEAGAEVRDGRLTCRAKAHPSWVAEAATGRLLSLVMGSEELRAEVSFVPDGVQRLLARHADATKTAVWQEAVGGSRATMAEVLLNQVQNLFQFLHADDRARYARQLAAIGPVIRDVIIPALDPPPTASSDATGFYIPWKSHILSQSEIETQMYGERPARWSAWAAENLPLDSWPVVLLRATQAHLAGKKAYVEEDLHALFMSDRFGPVGCLVTAQLLRMVDPVSAGTFAQRGLGCLEAPQFLADAHLFDGLLKSVVARATAHPAAIDALAAFSGPMAAAVPELKAVLSDPRNTPEAKVDAVARIVWRSGLHDWVQEQLRGILATAPRRGLTY